MERGTVVEWLVDEGATVSVGEEILTVETDKSIVAVEARQAGTLTSIVVPAGEEVAVGTTLAIIVAPGEILPAEWSPSAVGRTAVIPDALSAAAIQTTATCEPETETVAGVEASWKARTMAREAGLALREVVGSGPRGRIVAADVEAALAQPIAGAAVPALLTPVAAHLATALGLDLSNVAGSGVGGRITQVDVLAVAAARLGTTTRSDRLQPAERVRAASESALPQVASSTPLKGVRKIVSEGMAASVHTTARVTLLREVDAGEVIRLRERFIARGIAVSYNDLLVSICAVALHEHPAANARLAADRIEHLDRANVGLAVHTERGLLVPVVHDAGRLSIPQIATETARLIAAARDGRLAPEDLEGGTFTITNLGMFGVEAFTPVINLPECCILGVGKIVRKPVVVDQEDTIAVRSMMMLSLVFDHRVIDGAPAAHFLDCIAQMIEDPLLLLAGGM
ncbi:MAG: 2-oxo acid dehydrogenase subunit E2 [Anaerolineae bacterium]|nr:2-oxo acid dehydrogenase subunit E2 [Anaerolineae bacterium]